jgi:hypothetical protein
MKSNSWRDELLEDVLSEAAPPSAQADSLGGMLAELQRHGRQRRRVRALATVCLVFAIGFTLKWSSLLLSPSVGTTGFSVVHTRPLGTGLLVQTEPGEISVVSASSTGIAIVEALPEHELFERIDDEKLLAFLAGHPAALIQHGLGRELIFADPADAAGFQVH